MGLVSKDTLFPESELKTPREVMLEDPSTHRTGLNFRH
jgi:hypothetical protein